jgi:3-hydroxyisobutyrate dehydrogenase
MTNVGFIGIGAMGKPMAQNLIKSGKVALHIFDLNTAAVAELAALGASPCRSPKELAEVSSVMIMMLPNAAIVESTLTGEQGLLAGAKAGQTIIDMSSVAAVSTKKMAALAGAKGIAYIDAPVSGGVAGAQAGSLTIMVGGEMAAVQAVEPILQIVGKKIYHVGDSGAGDSMKVVNNLLLGINMAAVAEALVLGVKSGLNPQVMVDIIKESSGRSYALEAKADKFVLKNNFTAGFAIDLEYKDLELAMETAKSLEVPLPVGAMAQQVFAMAKAKGLGREDISAVVKVWEELVGVQVRE